MDDFNSPTKKKPSSYGDEFGPKTLSNQNYVQLQSTMQKWYNDHPEATAFITPSKFQQQYTSFQRFGNRRSFTNTFYSIKNAILANAQSSSSKAVGFSNDDPEESGSKFK